jgi:hypothetical protein
MKKMMIKSLTMKKYQGTNFLKKTIKAKMKKKTNRNQRNEVKNCNTNKIK